MLAGKYALVNLEILVVNAIGTTDWNTALERFSWEVGSGLGAQTEQQNSNTVCVVYAQGHDGACSVGKSSRSIIIIKGVGVCSALSRDHAFCQSAHAHRH